MPLNLYRSEEGEEVRCLSPHYSRSSASSDSRHVACGLAFTHSALQAVAGAVATVLCCSSELRIDAMVRYVALGILLDRAIPVLQEAQVAEEEEGLESASALPFLCPLALGCILVACKQHLAYGPLISELLESARRAGLPGALVSAREVREAELWLVCAVPIGVPPASLVTTHIAAMLGSLGAPLVSNELCLAIVNLLLRHAGGGGETAGWLTGGGRLLAAAIISAAAALSIPKEQRAAAAPLLAWICGGENLADVRGVTELIICIAISRGGTETCRDCNV